MPPTLQSPQLLAWVPSTRWSSPGCRPAPRHAAKDEICSVEEHGHHALQVEYLCRLKFTAWQLHMEGTAARAWRQTRTSFCTMPCCRNGHAAMTSLNLCPRTIVHQHNLRVLQIGLPCFCRKDVKLLLSFIAYDFDARRAWIILVMVSSFTMTTQTANRFDAAGSQRLPIFCWVLRCCGIAAHTLQVQQQPAWQLHIVQASLIHE